MKGKWKNITLLFLLWMSLDFVCNLPTDLLRGAILQDINNSLICLHI